MSDWSGPPPVAQDFPRTETNGVRQLVGVIKDQGTAIREATSNLLSTAGIFLTKTGMRIASSLSVEGDLNATGNTDIDGTLNVDAAMTVGGNATFNGAMSIAGTLSLPAGIIDNAALANPLTPLSTYNSVVAFGLTTTVADVVTATVVVPDGFTKCYAIGLGSIYFVNPTPSVDYVYARVYIDTAGQSWWGARPLSMVGPNNGSAALAPNRIATLTGLTGGQVITFSLRAFTGFQPMSHSTNFGTIDAGCTFFR